MSGFATTRADPEWRSIGRRVAGAAAIALLATAAPRSAPSSSVRLYDEDPTHLWNRLHASLFVRVAADGSEHGGDRVDPLLWTGSTYLLQGPSHDQAVKVINEFVATHGERLIGDPLKRAVLQRDLWAVFDWLHGRHDPYRQPRLTPDRVHESAEELSGPLGTAIARLALTSDVIRALPGNYAAAAQTGAVPPDLYTAGGPWVSVGRPDGPVAAQHVRDSGPGTNSVFLVLIKLPGGRDATVPYLDALRAFQGPFWVQGSPNPALPQFPIGTQVALARRALLIDSAGRITPSPLTEQVQLRVYREIREMTAQEFADASRIEEHMFARAGQDFEEFSLTRAALFSGTSGGLLPLGAVDRVFLTFSSHGIDPLETATAQVGSDAAGAKRICKDCHAAPGVYSFNSYMPFRLLGPGTGRAGRLSEIPLKDAERTAIAWKQQREDWSALKPRLRP